MKNFMMILMVASFFTGAAAFAEEIDTDCIMMQEHNDRSNPKGNLDDKQVEKPRTKSSTAQ